LNLPRSCQNFSIFSSQPKEKSPVLLFFIFFLIVGPAFGLFLCILATFFQIQFQIFTIGTEFLSNTCYIAPLFEVDESNPVPLSISSSLLSISPHLPSPPFNRNFKILFVIVLKSSKIKRSTTYGVIPMCTKACGGLV
jgi:ribose/xylose/arabinose/galactoside ABC-type transport system permease subunit